MSSQAIPLDDPQSIDEHALPSPEYGADDAEARPVPHSDIREILRHERLPRPEEPAAHALVQALVEAGVDTFFGIPGGPISPVFDAVLQVAGARLIESRHESSAAFAAADYYRASGKIPAVLVTAGPGATNVVTGVVSAHLERTPMLVVCGDVAWALRRPEEPLSSANHHAALPGV
jgi:hypothetical protein